MLNNLKASVVVVVLAWIAFRFARPLCLQYMSAQTFVRRRNVWFALTVVAFVSPTFWVYALFAIALLSWAAARDENPLALYVLVTFAVPNASFFLPTFLINQLFDLTQYRLLSLVILIPVVVRNWKSPLLSTDNKLRPADWFLMAYLLLQVVLQSPYESITAMARRGFLLGIDTFVVFYAFSRISDRQKISEVALNFWLACGVMALVGIFEWSKGWLLYTGLSELWGDPNIFAFIFRGGGLRAQAAANHSLNLGYVLAVSLGLFLYLRSRSQRAWFDWAVIGILCVGLYTSGSRGAWIMAMLVALLFVMFRPGAARKITGAAAVGTLVLAGMYLTPLKESVIDRMPLIGTSDQDTVDYRQQLWDVSIPLIRQNPLFGDPFVAQNMESMRQGQGIIDIVNGYLFTALFYGLVGLFLQMAALLVGFWKAGVTLWRVRGVDGDAGLLGAGLVAIFAGSLFFIATAGYGPITYLLSALLLSYSRCMDRALATAGAVAQPDLNRIGSQTVA